MTTIAYIFEIAQSIAAVGVLALLGCILLELRQARHNQTARGNPRRDWVTDEHHNQPTREGNRRRLMAEEHRSD